MFVFCQVVNTMKILILLWRAATWHCKSRKMDAVKDKILDKMAFNKVQNWECRVTDNFCTILNNCKSTLKYVHYFSKPKTIFKIFLFGSQLFTLKLTPNWNALSFARFAHSILIIFSCKTILKTFLRQKLRHLAKLSIT